MFGEYTFLVTAIVLGLSIGLSFALFSWWFNKLGEKERVKNNYDINQKADEAALRLVKAIDSRIYRRLLQAGVAKGWSRYKHLKTGNYYDFLLKGKHEATGKDVAIYSNIDTNEVWVRLYDEFMDEKRFVEVKGEDNEYKSRSD